MRSFQKYFIVLIASLNLFGLQSLSATYYNTYCDPCNYDLCCQKVEFGADFLYWKPCIDDLDVAAFLRDVSDVDRVVDYKCMCLDWEPGVRAYLKLPELFCAGNLLASYSYIHSCDKARQRFDEANSENGIISPLIFTGSPMEFVGPFESGKENWELCYHEWEVLAAYNICCNSCHFFSPYFGVAGIYLDQELKASFSILEETTLSKDFVKWNSDYWGVGLRFGSYYQYMVCDGLNVFATANATLLAGETCTTNKQIYTAASDEFSSIASIKFKDSDCCHFVPGYHILIGLNYLSCWCDCEFGARLGYEFVYWLNIPNHRVFSNDTRVSVIDPEASILIESESSISHSSSPDTRTLGFHGLVAGLYFSF